MISKSMILVFLVAFSNFGAGAQEDDPSVVQRSEVTGGDEVVSEEVQREIELLASRDGEVRAVAAWKLGEMGEKAAPAVRDLIRLLQEGPNDPYLMVIRDEESSELMTYRRRFGGQSGKNLDGHGSASFIAAHALRSIGRPAVDGLIAHLEDQDPDKIRVNGPYSCEGVVEILGYIGDPRAFQSLLRMLDTSDENLRHRAARAIVQVNHPDTIETLIETLNDESKYLREGAADALGRMKAPEAINGLASLLDDEVLNVRREAVAALGRIYHSELPEKN